MSLASLALLVACIDRDGDPIDTVTGPDSAEPGTDSTGSGDTSPATEQHCTEVDAFVPGFAEDITRFTTEDDLSAGPVDSVVFVGSSSVRRWEELAQLYTDYAPVQRGVGGSQLGEIAQAGDALVFRHDPRAVVLFAGTNDVDAGVAPEVVIERFRCFHERMANALGADRPLLYIGITPTPARWDHWGNASVVNTAVESIADEDPGVVYVDVPAAFLATGSPPSADLYTDDGIHLSAAGYALWDSVLRPAVEGTVAPRTADGTGALPAGTRILVDLGPSNADDGEQTPSPDYLGQHWNNWHTLDGGEDVIPGEHLDALVDDAGVLTGIDLVVTGGFYVNGRSNGGLIWPQTALLADLAVGSATGDYFYALPEDQTGGLQLRGLDPGQHYSLRLFAARDDPERRVTLYMLRGASEASATLQTSGAGAGSAGATTNDDTVVTFAGVQPDAWGNLFLDVSIAEGSYAYLALVELTVDG